MKRYQANIVGGEKSGMHYEGLLQHYYKTRDGFHNCSLYGIIRNEWEQKCEVSCL